MLFNSYTFICFFLAVLLLHNLPLPWRVKKFNLLWASYLFYAAWNPPFVLLLWISTLVDWFVSKRIYRAESLLKRRSWLIISLSVNLGFLVYFKYTYFLLNNLVVFLASVGITYQPPELDIILPVGISFYTFQTLSYTLDIYRKKMKPWNSMLDFAMFVTFFPQLVAGPIVRAADFLPQCVSWNKPTHKQFGWGLVLMILGLFQKTVLADGVLAPFVERVYDTAMSPDPLAAWAATTAFAGQIFCDFAGYSTIAIGVAMCLGFHLPDNFRFPYAAIGFSDFWRRWHISLSSWLRDYLYISLGGNRQGTARTYVNLALTMLIGGLWHGASWLFVIWGGLHGTYLIVEHWLTARYGTNPIWTRKHVQFGLWLLTFVLVCVTWAFFRAKELGTAMSISGAMFGFGGADNPFSLNESSLIFTVVGAILALHWYLRNRTLEDAATRLPWWLISVLLGVMVTLITIMPGEDRAFIYFQF